VSSLRYVPGNAQHIGSRQDQQDSFGFSCLDAESSSSHRGFLAVIADGMGGLANGKEASRVAIQAFLASYEVKREDESVPEALQRAVLDANRAVVEAGTRSGAPGDVGSTLVAAVLCKQSLYWASVGDSALYLLRQGHLTTLNCGHTYANDLDRRASEGSISAQEAFRHPDRETLTSYLGQDPLAEIELTVKPFPLQGGDQVLLSTDGLFKTLSEAEMQDAVDQDPQRSCEQWVRRALDANLEHQDNLTVLAVGFDSDDRTNPGAERTASGRRRSTKTRQKYAIAAICIALVCGAIVFAVLAHFRRRIQLASPAQMRLATQRAKPAQHGDQDSRLGKTSEAPKGENPPRKASRQSLKF
jgi:PPM family protein phosphatase